MKHLKTVLKQQEEQTKTRDLIGRRAINRILRGGHLLQNNHQPLLNTSVHEVSKAWSNCLKYMDKNEEEMVHREQYILSEFPENIVLGTAYIDVEKLTTFEETHTKNVQYVLDSVKHYGAMFSVAITPDFIILDGHHRVETCRILNVEKVPCTIVNLDAPEIRTGNIKVSKQRIREVAGTKNLLPFKSTRITVMGKPIFLLSKIMKVQIP